MQSRFRRDFLSTDPGSQTDVHGFPFPRNCIVILEANTRSARTFSRQIKIEVSSDADFTAIFDAIARPESALRLRKCSDEGKLASTEAPGLHLSDSALSIRGAMKARPSDRRFETCFALLVRPTELDTAEALSLVSYFPAVRLVPFGHAGPALLCNSLTSIIEMDCGPVGGVALAVNAELPHLVDRHLLFALLLGRRRLGIRTFAQSMGTAARTLQHTTHEVHLPNPHRLLLWGQAFWCLWRIKRWGMTSRQVAAAGGFRTTASMSAALAPLLGHTPHRAASTLTEAQLTDVFLTDLAFHSGHFDRPEVALL